MRKPIQFQKCISAGVLARTGILPSGAVMQGQFSVVTKRQEVAIGRSLRKGRFLLEPDLIHFKDSHCELIQHAIESRLLGDPKHAGHFSTILKIAVVHTTRLENALLGMVLLEYLLLLADEAYIDIYVRGVLALDINAVAEIRARYLAKTLNGNLARKPLPQSQSRTLKV